MLSDSNLHLTAIGNLFFDISMLLYEDMLKLAELGNFLADFGNPRKMFLALKFEPLDKTRQNSELSKHKKFLTSGKEDNSMQLHLGCNKWQEHGANFT